MAQRFVLTAQIQLRAPTNTAQIVNQIRAQLQGITAQVNITVPPTQQRQLIQLQSQLKNVRNAAQNAGDTVTKFGQQAALAFKRFFAFSVATTAFIKFTQAIRGAVDDAIAFQNELVKIAQTTGLALNSLGKLTGTVTELSTTLGVSSSKLLEVSRILAQAGLSAADTEISLKALAKTELAPTFDNIINTTEGAIAIFSQFKIASSELEGALGSINAVSAAFAVESEDLITTVRRTGGAFQAAGGNLNELIALFTSVRATTRESAESIATGFRTIFTRIQRLSTQKFLENLGVQLRDVEGQFVGPYEAVRRLSTALASLEGTDPRFAQIIEELGGFRQVSKVIPLIKEFATAEKALAVAQRGQTSLAEDAATAQQSLAVQIRKVKEEFAALIRKVADSSSFKAFLDISLKLASALIKVADAITPVLPAIAALGAFKIGQVGRSFGTGFVQKIGGYASGGLVPGQGNRDTVPAMLTPGEFVVKKSAVEKIGANKLQKLQDGGMVRREIGYIDSDVLADPQNEAVVRKEMQTLDITSIKDYKKYLSKLASDARKQGSIDKLRVLASVPGAGKSSIIMGRGEQAKKTPRFPILKPSDIQRATEVFDTTTTVTPEKLDDFIKAADRVIVLSSSTKKEQEEVKRRRENRDVVGDTLFGRKPGSTKGADVDSGILEAQLMSEIDPKKLVVLKTEQGPLRRKKGEELVSVKEKKIGLFYGGFSPTTVGHESVKLAAEAFGIKDEDFMVLVGSNESLKRDDPHTWRTAIFDQDFRMMMAKAGFKGASFSKKSRDFDVPEVMEVDTQSKQRQFVKKDKGSIAFYSGADKKPDKYLKAGYIPQELSREEVPVSGTQAREAILSGNIPEMKKVLSPQVFEVVARNLKNLQNRAEILPKIIANITKKQDISLAKIEEQLKALPPKVDRKRAAVDPQYKEEVADKVDALRKTRDDIKGLINIKPFDIIKKLSERYPNQYALKFASGGLVPGQGNRDSVKAVLTPGEFVIRKNAVKKIGADNLQQINRGYADGGYVQRFQNAGTVEKVPIKEAVWSEEEKELKRKISKLQIRSGDDKKKWIELKTILDPIKSETENPLYKNVIKDRATIRIVSDLINELNYVAPRGIVGSTGDLNRLPSVGQMKSMESGQTGSRAGALRTKEIDAAEKQKLLEKPASRLTTQEKLKLAEIEKRKGLDSLKVGALFLEPVTSGKFLSLGSITGKVGPDDKEVVVDVEIGSMEPSKAQSIKKQINTSIVDLTSKLANQTWGDAAKILTLEEDDIGNLRGIQGSIFEAMISSVGVPFGGDETNEQRSWDFPTGLVGFPQLADSFQISRDVRPIDAKRKLTGDTKDSFKRKVKNSLQDIIAYQQKDTQTIEQEVRTDLQARHQGQNKFFGGPIQKFAGAGMVGKTKPSIDFKSFGFNPELTGRGISPGNVGVRKQIFLKAKDALEEKILKQEPLTEEEQALYKVLKKRIEAIAKNRQGRFLKDREGGFTKLKDGGSSTDTVPALLTPGEFVINKKAAGRIGIPTLTRMNNADKISGYAQGGLVQTFATGGAPAGGGFGALQSLGGLSILTSIISQTVKQFGGLNKQVEQVIDGLTSIAIQFSVFKGVFNAAIGQVQSIKLNAIAQKFEPAITSATTKIQKTQAALDKLTSAGQQGTVKYKNAEAAMIKHTAALKSLQSQYEKEQQILNKRMNQAQIFGNILSLASAAAITFGESLRTAGKAALESGQFTRGREEMISGGRLSGAGTGAQSLGTLGATIGTLIAPGIGTAIGGAIGAGVGGGGGAILGGRAAAMEADRIEASVRFNREFESLIKDMQKVEAGKSVSSPQVLTNALLGGAAQSLATAPSDQNVQDINASIRNQATVIDSMLRKVAETSGSFEDFNKKISTEQLSVYANATGQSLSSLIREYTKYIENVKKANAAAENFTKIADKYAESITLLLSINQAFTEATDSVNRFISVADNITDMEGGLTPTKVLDTSNIFANAANFVDSKKIGEEIAREFARNPIFNFRRVTPEGEAKETIGQQLAKDANIVYDTMRKLPAILTSIRGKSGLETDVDIAGEINRQLSQSIGGELPDFVKTAIENGVAKLSGGEAGSANFLKRLKTDLPAVMEELGSQFKPLLETLQTASQAMNTELNRQAELLRRRTEIEMAMSQKLQELYDMRVSNERLLAEVERRPVNVGVARREEQNRRREALPLGGLVSDPNIIFKMLQASQRKQASLQDQLAKAEFTKRSALLAQIEKEKAAASRLVQSLKFLTDVTERVAAAQEELSQIRAERDIIRNVAEEIVFAESPEELGQTGRKLASAQVLAATNDLSKIPIDMRREVQAFLQQVGDTKLAALGGRSGTDILKATTSRELQGRYGLAKEDADKMAQVTTTDREKELIEQIKTATRTAETAQQKLIDGLRDNASRLSDILAESNKRFLAELENIFLEQNRRELESQRDVKVQEREGAADKLASVYAIQEIMKQTPGLGIDVNTETAEGANRFEVMREFFASGQARKLREESNKYAGVSVSNIDILDRLSNNQDLPAPIGIGMQKMQDVIKPYLQDGVAYDSLKALSGQERSDLTENFLLELERTLTTSGIYSEEIVTSLKDAARSAFAGQLKQGASLPAIFDNVMKSVRTRAGELSDQFANNNVALKEQARALKITEDQLKTLLNIPGGEKTFTEFEKMFSKLAKGDTVPTLKANFEKLATSVFELGTAITTVTDKIDKNTTAAGGAPAPATNPFAAGLDWLKGVLGIKMAKGGKVPGYGTGDTVPAMLTPGEYVINASAVKAIGESNLNAMNRGGNVRKLAKGGSIIKNKNEAEMDPFYGASLPKKKQKPKLSTPIINRKIFQDEQDYINSNVYQKALKQFKAGKGPPPPPTPERLKPPRDPFFDFPNVPSDMSSPARKLPYYEAESKIQPTIRKLPYYEAESKIEPAIRNLSNNFSDADYIFRPSDRESALSPQIPSTAISQEDKDAEWIFRPSDRGPVTTDLLSRPKGFADGGLISGLLGAAASTASPVIDFITGIGEAILKKKEEEEAKKAEKTGGIFGAIATPIASAIFGPIGGAIAGKLAGAAAATVAKEVNKTTSAEKKSSDITEAEKLKKEAEEQRKKRIAETKAKYSKPVRGARNLTDEQAENIIAREDEVKRRQDLRGYIPLEERNKAIQEKRAEIIKQRAVERKVKLPPPKTDEERKAQINRLAKNWKPRSSDERSKVLLGKTDVTDKYVMGADAMAFMLEKNPERAKELGITQEQVDKRREERVVRRYELSGYNAEQKAAMAKKQSEDTDIIGRLYPNLINDAEKAKVDKQALEAEARKKSAEQAIKRADEAINEKQNRLARSIATGRMGESGAKAVYAKDPIVKGKVEGVIRRAGVGIGFQEGGWLPTRPTILTPEQVDELFNKNTLTQAESDTLKANDYIKWQQWQVKSSNLENAISKFASPEEIQAIKDKQNSGKELSRMELSALRNAAADEEVKKNEGLIKETLGSNAEMTYENLINAKAKAETKRKEEEKAQYEAKEKEWYNSLSPAQKEGVDQAKRKYAEIQENFNKTQEQKRAAELEAVRKRREETDRIEMERSNGAELIKEVFGPNAPITYNNFSLAREQKRLVEKQVEATKTAERTAFLDTTYNTPEKLSNELNRMDKALADATSDEEKKLIEQDINILRNLFLGKRKNQAYNLTEEQEAAKKQQEALKEQQKAQSKAEFEKAGIVGKVFLGGSQIMTGVGEGVGYVAGALSEDLTPIFGRQNISEDDWASRFALGAQDIGAGIVSGVGYSAVQGVGTIATTTVAGAGAGIAAALGDTETAKQLGRIALSPFEPPKDYRGTAEQYKRLWAGEDISGTQKELDRQVREGILSPDAAKAIIQYRDLTANAVVAAAGEALPGVVAGRLKVPSIVGKVQNISEYDEFTAAKINRSNEVTRAIRESSGRITTKTPSKLISQTDTGIVSAPEELKDMFGTIDVTPQIKAPNIPSVQSIDTGIDKGQAISQFDVSTNKKVVTLRDIRDKIINDLPTIEEPDILKAIPEEGKTLPKARPYVDEDLKRAQDVLEKAKEDRKIQKALKESEPAKSPQNKSIQDVANENAKFSFGKTIKEKIKNFFSKQAEVVPTQTEVVPRQTPDISIDDIKRQDTIDITKAPDYKEPQPSRKKLPTPEEKEAYQAKKGAKIQQGNKAEAERIRKQAERRQKLTDETQAEAQKKPTINDIKRQQAKELAERQMKPYEKQVEEFRAGQEKAAVAKADFRYRSTANFDALEDIDKIPREQIISLEGDSPPRVVQELVEKREPIVIDLVEGRADKLKSEPKFLTKLDIDRPLPSNKQISAREQRAIIEDRKRLERERLAGNIVQEEPINWYDLPPDQQTLILQQRNEENLRVLGKSDSLSPLEYGQAQNQPGRISPQYQAYLKRKQIKAVQTPDMSMSKLSQQPEAIDTLVGTIKSRFKADSKTPGVKIFKENIKEYSDKFLKDNFGISSEDLGVDLYADTEILETALKEGAEDTSKRGISLTRGFHNRGKVFMRPGESFDTLKHELSHALHLKLSKLNLVDELNTELENLSNLAKQPEFFISTAKLPEFKGNITFSDDKWLNYATKPKELAAELMATEQPDVMKYIQGILRGMGETERAALKNVRRLGGIIHVETGSFIPGAGTGDSVPAMLEPGEFVLNKSAVKSIGVNRLNDINFRQYPRFQTGGRVGMQTGGTPPAGGMLTIDPQSLSTFDASVKFFSESADRLSQMLKGFPQTLTIEGKHTVEIIINGAQVLTTIMPEISKLVESAAKDSLNKMIKDKFPDVGTVG